MLVISTQTSSLCSGVLKCVPLLQHRASVWESGATKLDVL